MNRELKKQIAKAFDAPTPGRKVQFIHSLPRPHISTKTFICSQIPFIKKSVWLMSILILLPVAWRLLLQVKIRYGLYLHLPLFLHCCLLQKAQNLPYTE